MMIHDGLIHVDEPATIEALMDRARKVHAKMRAVSRDGKHSQSLAIGAPKAAAILIAPRADLKPKCLSADETIFLTIFVSKFIRGIRNGLMNNSVARPSKNSTGQARDIIRYVSYISGFSISEICGQQRHSELMAARYTAIFLCKVHTILSLPSIGKCFGNRDHTSILHAARRVRKIVDRSCIDLGDDPHSNADVLWGAWIAGQWK